jgi:hypothetical protein
LDQNHESPKKLEVTSHYGLKVDLSTIKPVSQELKGSQTTEVAKNNRSGRIWKQIPMPFEEKTSRERLKVVFGLR